MKFIVIVNDTRYVVSAGSVAGAIRNALTTEDVDPAPDKSGYVEIKVKPV